MITKVLICILFTLTSCANYVAKMHRQLDAQNRKQIRPSYREQGYTGRQKKFYDPYNGYRGIPVAKNDARPIKSPLTLGGPQRRATVVKRINNKRFTSEDLKDNSSTASLWSDKEKGSFLFVPNNSRRSGDVVIVDVYKNMKSNITEELKRAFPLKAKKKKDKGDEPNKESTNKEETKVAASSNKPSEGEVYDKISTQIIEKINKDYFLIRGRKEVMFQDRKRYVELRALVSRKVIKDNDTVKSSDLLEPKIKALRY
ncbi:MAG: flagellar basal body L-ring protein FlgH [Bacteriovoracaceae bacterium]|jgi:flagellar basal body L-ring protein FlgH|nr:flagellar basal body L-ring protein FlgH [Bacteriovoracaceae bacterium]